MFENNLLVQAWRLNFDEIELVKGGKTKSKEGSSVSRNKINSTHFSNCWKIASYSGS